MPTTCYGGTAKARTYSFMHIEHIAAQGAVAKDDLSTAKRLLTTLKVRGLLLWSTTVKPIGA